MPTFTFAWPDRGYFYVLLVVSLLCAKGLHLFSHLPALPIFLFLLYFPTFVFPDVVVVLVSRVLFQRVPILGYILWCVRRYPVRLLLTVVVSSSRPPRRPKLASSSRRAARFAGT